MIDVLLRAPAFCFAVWLMYWSLPLGNVFLCLKAWKLIGPRNDVYRWCGLCTQHKQTRLLPAAAVVCFNQQLAMMQV